jgi:hypothetical protein
VIIADIVIATALFIMFVSGGLGLMMHHAGLMIGEGSAPAFDGFSAMSSEETDRVLSR